MFHSNKRELPSISSLLFCSNHLQLLGETGKVLARVIARLTRQTNERAWTQLERKKTG